jgi:hypothetical protein
MCVADGGRQSGDAAGHDHDVHVLRLLRHVERTRLPVVAQVGVRAGSLPQPHVLPRRVRIRHRPALRHLLEALAGHLPDRSALRFWSVTV